MSFESLMTVSQRLTVSVETLAALEVYSPAPPIALVVAKRPS